MSVKADMDTGTFVVLIAIGVALVLFGLWQFRKAGEQVDRIQKDMEEFLRKMKDGSTDQEV